MEGAPDSSTSTGQKMLELPCPDETKPSIDWENEIVIELKADGMYEEMIDLASGEFENHIRDLKKMLGQTPDEWGNWPPWKVAHSIKGLCLSLSFSRLAHFAQSIEKLKEAIRLDDLPVIITTLESLFETAIQEAKKKKRDD
mmetsp:Transcript_24277/g.74910  ORF Transcript_24277/g.74910 Transcript_24277/m.74910 type:complete len:142 (-) Transcript_24277:1376-1801(-)